MTDLRETQFGEDRCTQFRVIVVSHTHTQTHTRRQDRLQYTAPQLARSVITAVDRERSSSPDMRRQSNRDLNVIKIEEFCVTRRKAARRIWSVPYNTPSGIGLSALLVFISVWWVVLTSLELHSCLQYFRMFSGPRCCKLWYVIWTNAFNNWTKCLFFCALCSINVPQVICLQEDCHMINYFNSLFLVWVLRQWGVLIACLKWFYWGLVRRIYQALLQQGKIMTVC